MSVASTDWMNPTHDELVKRAIRWLAGTRRCRVVVDDGPLGHSEKPDAIGWRCGGWESILVECKTSLSDFYADKKKPHRQGDGSGMGRERWYMTPPGLLKPEQIPDGWGLVEAGPRCRIIKRATERDAWNSVAEVDLLLTIHCGWASSNVRVFAVPECESVVEE